MAEMVGWRPIPALFDTIPEQTRAAWHLDLAHQMVVPPNPDEALAAVRAAWAAAIPA